MADLESNPLGMRLSAVALLLAIFVAGAFTGAGVYRWAAHDAHPMGPPPEMGPLGPHAHLGLSAEQNKQVEAIMQKYRPELESVIRETFPRVKAVHDKIDAEIRPLLNDEQRRRFDEMLAHRPSGPGLAMGGPHHHGPRLGMPPPPPPGFPMGPGRELTPPPMGSASIGSPVPLAPPDPSGTQ